ncbi:FGGY family carbohydrate kinase, partial [Klebsiella pneumoniae]|nr:FGGY family carbohydrate kinase [Klebsiella pneumoniae]
RMYLGLDVGTSVIKAALFDGDGAELASLSRRMALRPAPLGWSELEAEDTWAAVRAVLGGLLAGRDPRALRGMGVTGVMVGAWLLDAGGAVLR